MYGRECACVRARAIVVSACVSGCAWSVYACMCVGVVRGQEAATAPLLGFRGTSTRVEHGAPGGGGPRMRKQRFVCLPPCVSRSVASCRGYRHQKAKKRGAHFWGSRTPQKWFVAAVHTTTYPVPKCAVVERRGSLGAGAFFGVSRFYLVTVH